MELANQAEEKGFWLPPEFLDDDMFLAGEEDVQPASFHADMGCRNAPSFFFDDDKNQSPAFSAAGSINHKSLVGSPQSTLCRTASPPSTPSTIQSAAEDDDALEVLYAAAREIAAMRKLQEHHQHQQKQLLLRQILQQQQEQYCGGGFLAPTPANFPPANFVRHAPTLHEIQLIRLRQQELLIKQQLLAMAWANGQNRERVAGFNGYPALHHQNHQHHRIGSGGMRAIFLNSSGKESAGTGVFLPKRAAGAGAPSDHQLRKKSGCSTVLVPARVMQALNLDIDKLAAGGHPRYPAGYVIDHGSRILTLRGQKNAVAGEEVGLPTEWTY